MSKSNVETADCFACSDLLARRSFPFFVKPGMHTPSLLGPGIAFLVCAGVGYFVASAFVAPDRHGGVSSPPEIRSAVEELGPMPEGHSAFIAEWEKFRGAAPASSANLSERFLASIELEDNFHRRSFQAALIAEWTVTDPAAALALFREKNWVGEIFQLAREWMRHDPDAAIAALLAGGQWGKDALRDVLNEVATMAPTRLAEVASAGRVDSPRYGSEALARAALDAGACPRGRSPWAHASRA